MTPVSSIMTALPLIMLKRHVASHNAGDVIWTKPNRPAKLLSYLAVQSEQQARALEKYFKTGSGKAFADKRLW